MRAAWLLVRLAVRNLWRNTARTACALGAIGAGAAALLLFMGFNTGLMNEYRDNTVRAHFGHGQLHVRGYWGRTHAHPAEMWIAEPERVSICAACDGGMEWIEPPVCGRCGAARSGPACAECRDKAFVFAGAVSLGRYAGRLRELVLDLKFRGGRHLAHPKNTPLCNLYAAMLRRMGTPVERFGDSTAELALD